MYLRVHTRPECPVLLQTQPAVWLPLTFVYADTISGRRQREEGLRAGCFYPNENFLFLIQKELFYSLGWIKFKLCWRFVLFISAAEGKARGRSYPWPQTTSAAVCTLLVRTVLLVLVTSPKYAARKQKTGPNPAKSCSKSGY